MEDAYQLDLERHKIKSAPSSLTARHEGNYGMLNDRSGGRVGKNEASSIFSGATTTYMTATGSSTACRKPTPQPPSQSTIDPRHALALLMKESELFSMRKGGVRVGGGGLFADGETKISRNRPQPLGPVISGKGQPLYSFQSSTSSPATSFAVAVPQPPLSTSSTSPSIPHQKEPVLSFSDPPPTQRGEGGRSAGSGYRDYYSTSSSLPAVGGGSGVGGVAYVTSTLLRSLNGPNLDIPSLESYEDQMRSMIIGNETRCWAHIIRAKLTALCHDEERSALALSYKIGRKAILSEEAFEFSIPALQKIHHRHHQEDKRSSTAATPENDVTEKKSSSISLQRMVCEEINGRVSIMKNALANQQVADAYASLMSTQLFFDLEEKEFLPRNLGISGKSVGGSVLRWMRRFEALERDEIDQRLNLVIAGVEELEQSRARARAWLLATRQTHEFQVAERYLLESKELAARSDLEEKERKCFAVYVAESYQQRRWILQTDVPQWEIRHRARIELDEEQAFGETMVNFRKGLAKAFIISQQSALISREELLRWQISHEEANRIQQIFTRAERRWYELYELKLIEDEMGLGTHLIADDDNDQNADQSSHRSSMRTAKAAATASLRFLLHDEVCKRKDITRLFSTILEDLSYEEGDRRRFIRAMDRQREELLCECVDGRLILQRMETEQRKSLFKEIQLSNMYTRALDMRRQLVLDESYRRAMLMIDSTNAAESLRSHLDLLNVQQEEAHERKLLQNRAISGLGVVSTHLAAADPAVLRANLLYIEKTERGSIITAEDSQWQMLSAHIASIIRGGAVNLEIKLFREAETIARMNIYVEEAQSYISYVRVTDLLEREQIVRNDLRRMQSLKSISEVKLNVTSWQEESHRVNRIEKRWQKEVFDLAKSELAVKAEAIIRRERIENHEHEERRYLNLLFRRVNPLFKYESLLWRLQEDECNRRMGIESQAELTITSIFNNTVMRDLFSNTLGSVEYLKSLVGTRPVEYITIRSLSDDLMFDQKKEKNSSNSKTKEGENYKDKRNREEGDGDSANAPQRRPPRESYYYYTDEEEAIDEEDYIFSPKEMAVIYGLNSDNIGKNNNNRQMIRFDTSSGIKEETNSKKNAEREHGLDEDEVATRHKEKTKSSSSTIDVNDITSLRAYIQSSPDERRERAKLAARKPVCVTWGAFMLDQLLSENRREASKRISICQAESFWRKYTILIRHECLQRAALYELQQKMWEMSKAAWTRVAYRNISREREAFSEVFEAAEEENRTRVWIEERQAMLHFLSNRTQEEQKRFDEEQDDLRLRLLIWQGPLLNAFYEDRQRISQEAFDELQQITIEMRRELLYDEYKRNLAEYQLRNPHLEVIEMQRQRRNNYDQIAAQVGGGDAEDDLLPTTTFYKTMPSLQVHTSSTAERPIVVNESDETLHHYIDIRGDNKNKKEKSEKSSVVVLLRPRPPAAPSSGRAPWSLIAKSAERHGAAMLTAAQLIEDDLALRDVIERAENEEFRQICAECAAGLTWDSHRAVETVHLARARMDLLLLIAEAVDNDVTTDCTEGLSSSRVYNSSIDDFMFGGKAAMARSGRLRRRREKETEGAAQTAALHYATNVASLPTTTAATTEATTTATTTVIDASCEFIKGEEPHCSSYPLLTQKSRSVERGGRGNGASLFATARKPATIIGYNASLGDYDSLVVDMVNDNDDEHNNSIMSAPLLPAPRPGPLLTYEFRTFVEMYLKTRDNVFDEELRELNAISAKLLRERAAVARGERPDESTSTRSRVTADHKEVAPINRNEHKTLVENKERTEERKDDKSSRASIPPSIAAEAESASSLTPTHAETQQREQQDGAAHPADRALNGHISSSFSSSSTAKAPATTSPNTPSNYTSIPRKSSATALSVAGTLLSSSSPSQPSPSSSTSSSWAYFRCGNVITDGVLLEKIGAACVLISTAERDREREAIRVEKMVAEAERRSNRKERRRSEEEEETKKRISGHLTGEALATFESSENEAEARVDESYSIKHTRKEEHYADGDPKGDDIHVVGDEEENEDDKIFVEFALRLRITTDDLVGPHHVTPPTLMYLSQDDDLISIAPDIVKKATTTAQHTNKKNQQKRTSENGHSNETKQQACDDDEDGTNYCTSTGRRWSAPSLSSAVALMPEYVANLITALAHQGYTFESSSYPSTSSGGEPTTTTPYKWRLQDPCVNAAMYKRHLLSMAGLDSEFLDASWAAPIAKKISSSASATQHGSENKKNKGHGGDDNISGENNGDGNCYHFTIEASLVAVMRAHSVFPSSDCNNRGDTSLLFSPQQTPPIHSIIEIMTGTCEVAIDGKEGRPRPTTKAAHQQLKEKQMGREEEAEEEKAEQSNNATQALTDFVCSNTSITSLKQESFVVTMKMRPNIAGVLEAISEEEDKELAKDQEVEKNKNTKEDGDSSSTRSSGYDFYNAVANVVIHSDCFLDDQTESLNAAFDGTAFNTCTTENKTKSNGVFPHTVTSAKNNNNNHNNPATELLEEAISISTAATTSIPAMLMLSKPLLEGEPLGGNNHQQPDQHQPLGIMRNVDLNVLEAAAINPHRHHHHLIKTSMNRPEENDNESNNNYNNTTAPALPPKLLLFSTIVRDAVRAVATAGMGGAHTLVLPPSSATPVSLKHTQSSVPRRGEDTPHILAKRKSNVAITESSSIKTENNKIIIRDREPNNFIGRIGFVSLDNDVLTDDAYDTVLLRVRTTAGNASSTTIIPLKLPNSAAADVATAATTTTIKPAANVFLHQEDTLLSTRAFIDAFIRTKPSLSSNSDDSGHLPQQLKTAAATTTTASAANRKIYPNILLCVDNSSLLLSPSDLLRGNNNGEAAEAEKNKSLNSVGHSPSHWNWGTKFAIAEEKSISSDRNGDQDNHNHLYEKIASTTLPARSHPMTYWCTTVMNPSSSEDPSEKVTVVVELVVAGSMSSAKHNHANEKDGDRRREAADQQRDIATCDNDGGMATEGNAYAFLRMLLSPSSPHDNETVIQTETPFLAMVLPSSSNSSSGDGEEKEIDASQNDGKILIPSPPTRSKVGPSGSQPLTMVSSTCGADIRVGDNANKNPPTPPTHVQAAATTPAASFTTRDKGLSTTVPSSSSSFTASLLLLNEKVLAVAEINLSDLVSRALKGEKKEQSSTTPSIRCMSYEYMYCAAAASIGGGGGDEGSNEPETPYSPPQQQQQQSEERRGKGGGLRNKLSSLIASAAAHSVDDDDENIENSNNNTEQSSSSTPFSSSSHLPKKMQQDEEQSFTRLIAANVPLLPLSGPSSSGNEGQEQFGSVNEGLLQPKVTNLGMIQFTVLQLFV